MTEKGFEQFWIEKIRGEKKNFPSDFINYSKFREIETGGRVLTIGGEFFGNFEIVDIDGKIIAQAEHYAEAKFLIYSSLSKPETIPVPLNSEEIISAVKEYEKYLDDIISDMQKDFAEKFSESKNFNKVSNFIFNSLNLQRY